MKTGHTLLAAVCVAACAACGSTIKVTDASLMSGAELSTGRRGMASTFHLNDRIIQMVDFTWDDPKTDGGIHECEWRWYRDGKLVSDTPMKRLNFISTPFTLHTERAAAPFGVGRYTVETLVDDRVVAVSAFTIVG